jgi:DNA primase
VRFSQDFIDKVRDATNIVEIISQHAQLKRSGSKLSGLCPFPDHREKTASFSVDETKQFYYCFGCKRGGNCFTYLRDYQGLPFSEAVEFLAERAGIAIPKSSADKASHEEDERRKAFLKLNRDVALFYHQNLLKLSPTHPVRAYIKKRGLSDETVEQFMLGFASDSWNDLADFLKHSKTIQNALVLGLVKAKRSEGHFDTFRSRLIFPIISPVGEVLGFGGRILGEGNPKYLNSSESPIFSKGRVFYGLNEASKHIRAEDSIIVVEGYMDFLALYQAGIRNVVATLGTALTEEHARLLKRYTRNVVVLFDGDAAGLNAADRSLPVLLKAELLPRGFLLPENLDPDEYVRKEGAEKLKSELRGAQDLFVLYLGRLLKKFGGRSTDKVRFMDVVRPILSQMPDERLKDLYIEELASRLGVQVGWVQKSVRAAKGTVVAPPEKDKIVSKNNILKIKVPNEESMLLGLALNQEAFLSQIIASEVVQYFEHPLTKDLLDRVIELYGQRPNDFDKLTSILSSQIDDPSVLMQHLDTRMTDSSEDQGRQLLRDCVQKVKQRFLKSQARAIVNELKAEQDPKKLEQFVNILRDRKALEKE